MNFRTYTIVKNLWGAIKKNDAALQPVFEWMNEHPNTPINASDFDQSVFNKLGIALDDVTSSLNAQITTAGNNTSILKMAQLQVEIEVVYIDILPVNPFFLMVLRLI